MAIIKCKMCGGDLNVQEGQTVAECEYCGTKQTVPSADSEKKLTLFARANRLRFACEFDKAAGVYESLVADFPEEAEAYWGLVLCKYGIEYVDDPGTGKKVPTCHRSSFDSVMDDPNFEQAQENADAVARKVYREEAKAIEELRKGIIEVSGKEEPYDIFICYKETAENGDRTLDSVLAQDIYDALTEKGYRVFFSRITLEDKLGQEYEPYIFAALNSAKIMLAVGTDYEYYNAVWVKNEWSRYLQLMTQDKSKHLIPCYKNIDAYDMPKEFAKLQAQDLGKVGAMQDLLRGIEKIIPKIKPVTMVQEKVVVGGSGDNKIASLLDRGNMALEDGDWAKADSFFEDVLNNDSKNAQAYLGKTLAQERCRTIDAFARKRKDAVQSVQAQTLRLEPNNAHVSEAVKKYAVPGFVDADTIRGLYDFDLSYSSQAENRREQYQAEEAYWANHKWLSKAEKFAQGAIAENFTREKKALFAALSERVKQAEAAENAAIRDVKKRYEAHLKQADEKATRLYEGGLKPREEYYQTLLQTAQTSADVGKLAKTADALEKLGDYQNSKSLAEHCRKRTAEEKAKLAAEAERQRILKEKREKERKKKITIFSAVAAVVVIAVIAAALVVTKVIIPTSNYNKALALMENGQYTEAIAAFEALGDYKDAAAKKKDAAAKKKETHYLEAVALEQNGEYGKAAIAFGKAGDYQDAKERSLALWEQVAQRDTVSADFWHAVGLKSDGTVVAVGEYYAGQCDVSDWTDIVAVSAGGSHTVGLKSDGTVVAVGSNYNGQCDVSGWTDIVAISAGSGHTVGLKSDGTVVAVGDNEDGQCDVSGWTDIVAVSAGLSYTVGLKSDGTVVAVGNNDYGQCNVSDWRDIVAVSAGLSYTVGLKSDGTVVAVGDNDDGQCNVSGWKDIVAVFAGSSHTVGLKANGRVVTVGYNGDGRCDISGWKDIVAVSAGSLHTVGLKSDGTVVAVGWNAYGQCDVSGWRNIKIPKQK